jgi:hypothetical protein
MSWEAVARDYVLPGIQRALQREQKPVERAALKGS